MSVKRNCSVCGKECYCKKLGGVCKACRGDKKWSGEARLKAKMKYRRSKNNKVPG